MQFEDPRSILESAAAKPERELDAPALMSRGRRMRRIRYAALAAGLAVTVTGASASIAVMRADERENRPGPVSGDCPTDDTECLSRAAFCFDPAPLKASVYLRDDASEDELIELRGALLGMRGVGRLEYFSKEDAYEEFVRLFEDQPEVWENLSPDALPASFRVAVSDEATLRRIHELESPIIDETRSSLGVRERLCGVEAVPGPNVDVHRDVERYEEGPAEVTLYHCGVDPVLFAGRQWVVTSPPFDATNAPEDFTGRGRFEVRSDREGVYVDESGERLHFEAIERWTPPPCE